MKKVWFITGSSKGLGKSLVEAVLVKGDYVAATARNPEQLKELAEQYPEQLFPLKLDVEVKEQIYSSVEGAVKHFGRIDVLVNNAGFGITGAAEAFTSEQVQRQLNVNLYAPIEITRAVLPYMRKQGSGRILQISSIGGRVGNAGLSIYQAAKFGLTGFSESLSKEVSPLGIKVTSIEPGGFRTDWAGASMSFAEDIQGYEETVGGIKEYLTSGKFLPMGDPAKAAKVMVELADHAHPPLHLVLGSEAAAILKITDQNRKEEFEKWMDVTISTDHDEAVDLFQSEYGKQYLAKKGIDLE
ncbi:NAD(P)-dependent dehydrogenase (short-subunit alcohol dehydrogenase family) [Chryseobacterium sp. H1D6B]|uniref:SDR family NAD(P)-dependent oxidoreductase n=1 Tax=Chryseobacterium sp. H1D6B TaxID=2940588 RepID=UPI0015CBDCD9|nr:SDR family NAD(P)-dependent oxidoreductase [Chryseobacterium sp. H1D6B]MDH6251121.1 NAD(P)-dependent dehydrogenase (short-subunit alcohol dehydrogenase family) [Chryseobacterium sp. H1D6B]